MKINVGDFFMPFGERPISLALELAESQMWMWLDTFGLCPSSSAIQHMRRTRPEVITALYIPAADERTLPYLSQWMAWFFVIDDQFDHSGPTGKNSHRCAETIRSILAVIEEESTGPRRVGSQELPRAHRSLVDLWERLPEHLSASWRGSFREHIRDWLWSDYAETVDRATDRFPAIWEYREHRRDNVGNHMLLDLCEVTVEAELSEKARRLPSMMNLRKAAIEHTGIINDIRSLEKERANGDHRNVVLLIERNDEVSPDKAVKRAIDISSECVERMLTARRQLPEQLSAVELCDSDQKIALDVADQYLALVRGNFDYHFQTSRFQVGRYDHPDEFKAGSPHYLVEIFDERNGALLHQKSQTAQRRNW